MSQVDRVKEFVKVLREMDLGRDDYRKFADFLTLSYCALAKKTALNEEKAEALEARYMEVVGQYQRNLSAIREAMPKLLGITALSLVEAPGDFLGRCAGELEILNGRGGQFFTPFEVSRLMAEMLLGDAEPTIKERGFITLQEPASGAGGMVIAFAETVKARGYNPTETLVVEAIDVAENAFQMTFIQLTLLEIPARVWRANTLSGETFEVAHTPAYLEFTLEHGNPFRCEPRDEKDTQSEAQESLSSTNALSPILQQGGQLSLF